MAESSVPVDRDEFCCPICLDLFNIPATVPCGHTFCMKCITRCWDRGDTGIYRCPLCQETFKPRPTLGKNVLVATLVEKKKTCEAEPRLVTGLVWCDVCPRGMQLAVKSCLRCVASYCQAHLRPHYESPAFMKHHLIESTEHLQDMVCARHKEPLKVYCRTDQRCVCLLCVMDEHTHHDTVSIAAEHAARQANYRKMIQEREKKLQEARQAVDLITRTARTAVEDSEKLLDDIVRSVEKQCSVVKALILCEERVAVARAQGLQERLEQEATELRRRDVELQRLTQTGEHIRFLQCSRFPSAPPGHCNMPEVIADLNLSFESVNKAVSELRDQLVTTCQAEFDKLSKKVSRVNKMAVPPSKKRRAQADSLSTDTSRAQRQRVRSGDGGSAYGSPAIKVQILESPGSPPEPKTREEFLRYACQLTLDPNTAHAKLLLSVDGREVTWVKEKQRYPNGPERFDFKCQVLCREALSGRRYYWEAEVKGNKAEIAVTYNGIKRKGGGQATSFGGNDKSWSLDCINGVYSICHNSNGIKLPVPYCSRIGVYLDHQAGTLSFYSVSEVMTLLHRVETVFTEPVYAGFWLGEECRVKLVALVRHPNVPHYTIP